MFMQYLCSCTDFPKVPRQSPVRWLHSLPTPTPSQGRWPLAQHQAQSGSSFSAATPHCRLDRNWCMLDDRLWTVRNWGAVRDRPICPGVSPLSSGGGRLFIGGDRCGCRRPPPVSASEKPVTRRSRSRRRRPPPAVRRHCQSAPCFKFGPRRWPPFRPLVAADDSSWLEPTLMGLCESIGTGRWARRATITWWFNAPATGATCRRNFHFAADLRLNRFLRRSRNSLPFPDLLFWRISPSRRDGMLIKPLISYLNFPFRLID